MRPLSRTSARVPELRFQAGNHALQGPGHRPETMVVGGKNGLPNRPPVKYSHEERLVGNEGPIEAYGGPRIVIAEVLVFRAGIATGSRRCRW